MNSKDVLITGGAGFIGSHLVDALMLRGFHVTVFDNLSSGLLENIKPWLSHRGFAFIKGDLLNLFDLKRLFYKSYELVFHLAANPEVRASSTHPNVHFQQNVMATYNLLEFLREIKNPPTLVFTSTSTVYGEVTKIPTPEDYSPLEPISIYGATKLACEALITAYARIYGFKSIIYRLANIVGPRSKHGVIYDFVRKLNKNSKRLEILGDGTQTKSYLYISDCIEAMLLGLEKSKDQVGIYNVGSEDRIDVKAIARIAIEEMGLKDVELIFTGGINGGRGWIGDVKIMQLDITKLKSLGWRPKLKSEQAVRRTAGQLIAEVE